MSSIRHFSTFDFKRRANGFTLIEILIVIAIIGILAGVIITSTIAVRQKARETAAREQARQVKTALEAYFIDHDYYPGSPNTTITSADTTAWTIITNALIPNYASTIPTPTGFVYVYKTGEACPLDGNLPCSYELTTEKVETPDLPPVILPPSDEEPPPPPSPGASGQSYYVNALTGNDNNSGDDPNKAWRTITKLNNMMTTFQPGDQILFARGSTWSEKLIVRVSGSSASPITFSAYGEGDKPLIDLAGNVDFGIFVQDQAYLIFQNLAIKRAHSSAGPSAGVVLADTNNVVLDSLNITDIRGLGGVFIWATSAGKGQNNLIKNTIINNTLASSFGSSQGNRGNGLQLWAEACGTCGQGNRLEGNIITNNGGHGVGLFMPQTTVINNTISDNGEMGIGAAELKVNNSVISGNTITGNCQAKDDCFGINLFRVGANNLVSNNNVSAQHDTLNDPGVPINPGYSQKFGTGGIRFDGGDKSLGAGLDYMATLGNLITGNNINNEYDGVQIFNFNNISATGNTISGNRRAGLWAGSDNTAQQPVIITFTGNTLTDNNQNIVIYSNPANLVTVNQ